jgi:metallo-beta-lactamase family protein
MVTGGRIVRHLIAGLPDPKNTLLFVGHQAYGTPGRRIQEAADRGDNIWLDGEEVRIRARIETLRGLSAHADRGELEAWLSHIPNVKRVGLHHGEVSAQNDLVTYLGKGKAAVDAAHAHDADDGHRHGGSAGNVGQD